MKKLPVPTAENINNEHKLALRYAEDAVQHAVLCGELLLAKKAALSHGEFGDWVEKHCLFAKSTASLYMKASRQISNGVRILSLRHLFPSGQKPAKKTAVAKSPKAESPKSQLAESKKELADTRVRFDESVDTKSPPSAASIGKQEAKPAAVIPAPDFDFDGYEPEDDEEYQQRIENVMAADDKLAAMHKELKEQQGQLAQWKRSSDHYQNQAGEAVRMLKKEQNRVTALEKKLQKADAENEKLRERIAIMDEAA